MNWTNLWSLLKKLEGKVDSLELISFETVTELPETGEPNIIYLVPKSDPETGNYSDEYIWDSDNQTYEKIGDTQVSGTEILECTKSGNNLVLPTGIRCMDLRDDLDAGKDIILHFDNQYWYYIGNYIFWNIKPAKASIYGQIFATIHFLSVPMSYSDTIIPSVNDNNNFNIMNLPMPWQTGVAGKYLRVSTGAEQKYELVDPIPNANPNIADAYDATSTYDIGDLCIYNDILYECMTAITVAEVWTAAHWTAKTVADELASKADVSDIPADANHNIASAYDSTATYDLGDLCIYNGNLYECTTAISTAEEWTSAHWTQKTVSQELLDSTDAVYYIIDSSFTLLNGKTTTDIYDDIINGKIVFLKNYATSDVYCLGNCTSPTSLYFYRMSIDYVNDKCYIYRLKYNSSTSFVMKSSQIRRIADTELPAVTSADKGKVLEVNSSGRWAAATPDYAKDTSVAPLYDDTATYSVGDIVMYNKELYECTTAISVAEEWDSTHWTKTDIFSQMPTPGGASYVELGAKLLAGETTLTFTDESITTNSIFEFYTDAYGVNPTNVAVSTGSLVLTFDEQANNLKVKVRVWEDENPIPVVKSVDVLTTDTGANYASVKFTYKEDGAVIEEQNIKFSEADKPSNFGGMMAIDYGTIYNSWSITATVPVTYNGQNYAVGDIIKSWYYFSDVDFTVTAI